MRHDRNVSGYTGKTDSSDVCFDVSQRWKGVKENMLDYYWCDLTIVSTVSCLQTNFLITQESFL